MQSETSEDKLYKSSRFRIFVHLMAGFCIMATADNSGLTKQIINFLSFGQSSDITSSVLSMIISGILIVIGYFLSLKMTTIIDKSDLNETLKAFIVFTLPIIYFTAVFPLVAAINSLT